MFFLLPPPTPAHKNKAAAGPSIEKRERRLKERGRQRGRPTKRGKLKLLFFFQAVTTATDEPQTRNEKDRVGWFAYYFHPPPPTPFTSLPPCFFFYLFHTTLLAVVALVSCLPPFFYVVQRKLLPFLPLPPTFFSRTKKRREK